MTSSVVEHACAGRAIVERIEARLIAVGMEGFFIVGESLTGKGFRGLVIGLGRVLDGYVKMMENGKSELLDAVWRRFIYMPVSQVKHAHGGFRGNHGAPRTLGDYPGIENHTW